MSQNGINQLGNMLARSVQFMLFIVGFVFEVFFKVLNSILDAIQANTNPSFTFFQFHILETEQFCGWTRDRLKMK